ncbi:MAG: hypothetical protein WC915_06395 [archaeon]|jgi:hypothetical protein
MNTLARILGVATFGLIGCNLNAQDKSLNDSLIKENYNKEGLTYSLEDLNNDSIPDVVKIDYDSNLNGKWDIRAFHIVVSEDSLNYSVKFNPCMVLVDKNEDGKEDEVFTDSDLDGMLDYYTEIKRLVNL